MDTQAAPRPQRRRLAYWMAIAVVWAVMAAVLSLLLLVERFARAHAAHTANTALAQIGWQMRDDLDRGMSYRYEELRVLSGLHELQSHVAAPSRRELLERVQLSFPLYAWLGWVDRDGQVQAASQGLLEGLNVAQRPWFQGGLQGAYVGDVHPALLLEKLLPPQAEPWRFIDIAMPVHGADGQLQGVLGAHLSWQWVRDLQRGLLAPAETTYHAELFVVDSKGAVLLGPPGTEGKPLDLPELAQLQWTSAPAIRTWGDGLRYATATVPTIGHRNYPGLGWNVVVRQAEHVAMADYHQLQREMVIAGVLVCLLAALCAPLVARRLTRPLDLLTQAVATRAAGRPDPIPRLDAYREVALLSHTLAQADERERQHRSELERINAELEQRVAHRTAEIHASREQLRSITDNMPALVADLDPSLRFRYANQAYADWFGRTPASLIGQSLEDLYGPELVGAWLPQLQRVLQGQRVQFERSMVLNGQRQYTSATYLPCRTADGQLDGFRALVFDITAQKELELRLDNEATRDALTGLPNRRHLLREAPLALARADRQEHHVALLFMDLNGFKAINDTHGHEAGDALLCQVGLRLSQAVRQTDTVARLAGDEFVVLLEPVRDVLADPSLVADKIHAAMQAPFTLAGVQVHVSVSIGHAVYAPGSGLSADELLARADQGMYTAKRARRATV
jgi:diguanylate cyclase (GGDEF)-like protein/PAS domain S-box-containing protein